VEALWAWVTTKHMNVDRNCDHAPLPERTSRLFLSMQRSGELGFCDVPKNRFFWLQNHFSGHSNFEKSQGAVVIPICLLVVCSHVFVANHPGLESLLFFCWELS
jgi:hypothetical protein